MAGLMPTTNIRTTNCCGQMMTGMVMQTNQGQASPTTALKSTDSRMQIDSVASILTVTAGRMLAMIIQPSRLNGAIPMVTGTATMLRVRMVISVRRLKATLQSTASAVPMLTKMVIPIPMMAGQPPTGPTHSR